MSKRHDDGRKTVNWKKNKNKIKRTKCLEYYENIFEYKEKYTAKYL